MAETATLDTPKTAAPKKSTARNRALVASTELSPLQQAGQALTRFSELTKQLAQAKKELAEKSAPWVAEMEALKSALHLAATGPLLADFGTSKTMKLAGGVIGFKLGTKTLKMPVFEDAKKAAKCAADFLAIVEKHLPDAVVKEVDVKRVLEALEETPKMAVALEKKGILPEQKDNFFVTAARL
jgi:hypothetical protein